MNDLGPPQPLVPPPAAPSAPGLAEPLPSLAHDIAAWSLVGLGLLAILQLHLLPALLAGLLVHQLVNLLAPQLVRIRVQGHEARIVTVTVLFAITIGLIVVATSGLVLSIRSAVDSLPELMQRMASIIEARRHSWPEWLVRLLPADADAFETAAVAWLREHAGAVQTFWTNAGRTVVHLLLGMIIGAFIALRRAGPDVELRPLARSLALRVTRLGQSFRRVVFAQVRISAVNTFFTWLYLGVALPILGIELPLTKTLIAVTFVCGLLPVLGNLISNTVIVVVSLSHSWQLATASLVFLVVVHKLEYFLNARIIGTEIRARAWEMLIAMLAMEAAFGIPGVIAAPIYYAYVKSELTARGLI
jgi:predicted PurR-regulated permease PerM